MNEIRLEGCTATPLANYLKGLGVLRLLSQADPELGAAWQGECLTLHTRLSPQDVANYFLEQFVPTPIMAPWNGGSGFYEKDNKAALQAILASSTDRLIKYRACLQLIEEEIAEDDRASSPKDEAKTQLLTRIRNVLPDFALEWLDAAVMLSGDKAQYPPLLGTGGNDGRLDFTNNFMQRLTEVLPLNDEAPSLQSQNCLQAALYDAPTGDLIKKAIGQFSPGQVGGPNATTGYEADSLINPWDFVLMIEGALLFAAATVRRHEDDPEGSLSYPFTVRAVGAGTGSLGEGDASAARGELWMPLWQQPARYREVKALLGEGRVALGRKPARDALDFVRAVHRLGAYRGIHRFQRYGLLMRSGKAYLATPLGSVDIADKPQARWLDDLDAHDWLNRFRRFCQGDTVARRFLTLRRRLEDALFTFAGREPSKSETQALLILLGEIQQTLAHSHKAQEVVGPVPKLSEAWVVAADDGSPAFRIALALASLRGTQEAPLPLRAQLFPVHPRKAMWMEQARKAKGSGSDPACRVRIHTGQQGDLCSTLIAMLERRLWLAEQWHMHDKQHNSIKPLNGDAGASLDDVLHFLRDPSMDRRIADLMAGLSLCAIPPATEHEAGEGVVPAAFAMLKLCATSENTLRSLGWLGEHDNLPMPQGMLAQLAARQPRRAIEAAWRRLHASGIPPLFDRRSLPGLGNIDPRRAAAALLIPLRYGATAQMSRHILEKQNLSEMA